jgi:hypothetical protein
MDDVSVCGTATGLDVMDCRGYSGIVQARLDFRSASVRNAVGQPAQLIELIRVMDLAG